MDPEDDLAAGFFLVMPFGLTTAAILGWIIGPWAALWCFVGSIGVAIGVSAFFMFTE